MSDKPATQAPKLLHEEREAVQTLRRSLLRGRTFVLNELLKNLSKEVAVSILLESKRNVEVLFEINRAILGAVEHLRSS